MKKILMIMLLIVLLLPIKAYCQNVLSEDKETIIEDNRTLSQQLRYRFIEKDTYDIVDYIILFVIILLIIFIIVLLNERTYVYIKYDSVFMDEPVSITKTIKKDE